MYKLGAGNSVIRKQDALHIPPDVSNTDYKEFLSWKSAGNIPDPADPPSAEELAAAAQSLQDTADAASAKQYAKLKALSAMSPAQVDAWITANVNNLADAKDALKTLAIAVSVLSRRL